MPEEAKTRKTHCLEDLQRRILTLDLEPGSYLDETQIAEAYGISRPPLREILRQLAGEGYVVLQENRGAQVAPMTHKTLRNFFVAAPMIYAAMTQLAAENATAAQIAGLKDVQMLFRAAIRGGDAVERALMNERFHALIGEMADNEYLKPSLRRLLIDHTRIGVTFYSSHNLALVRERAIAADQHDQIIAAIEEHDGERAGELAIAHWELSRADIESFITPAGMQIPLGRVPDPEERRGAS